MELVIFECVKLGNTWTNNFIFSKLCVCCGFTIEKKQNMCKLVKVELESFCQIGNGNWLIVQNVVKYFPLTDSCHGIENYRT